MGLAQQTWTLTRKNLLIVLARHWLSTTIRAFLAPIIFMFFISYAKNFFVPPSTFGIGSPTPVRSLSNALDASIGGRDKVVFVHNGHRGGQIEQIINQVSSIVTASGKTSHTVSDETELIRACPSTLRGASNCFAAAAFHSSPTEGKGGKWNYTIRADGSFGEKVFVNRNDNDAEIYILPFQHAIDRAIASSNGSSIPNLIHQYPYTDKTQAQRDRTIVRLYQGSLIDFLALAYFIGVCGVTYQLVGQMATERELGMSQLIEAMMPNRRRWEPQAARMFSNHLSFDIIYMPAWIIMGAIVATLVFPQTSVGVLIGLHILIGLSLTSFSLLVGSFFHKAQLSGITAVIATLLLAIIAQLGVGADASTGAVAVLSVIFPPMTYTFAIIWNASFQQKGMAANLIHSAPDRPWQLSGIILWAFLIIQALVFPILAALVERSLYGTSSTDRKITHNRDVSPISVKLTNFSKHYGPGWFKRNILRCGRRKAKDHVVAVNDLTLNVLQGQIMILLGANGSGKSTTLDAIAGLNKITRGQIEIDGTGGLGLCPQKNVLWDELTCFEHVMIFNRLKSTDRAATKAETAQLITACDLDVKIDAKAKTLSGGQRRKLQLAMMFTGGSRVCCIDEVSSGIDPLARRKIWDILLAERGRRTILLTTHFLDEADVLSDHIAILSKGALKAEGSAAELKHKLGSGYRVSVENASHFVPDKNFEYAPRFVDYDQTVYHLPDSTSVSRFIASLDDAGVHGYRVQGPTVEDVFLKLADEIREDFEANTTTPPVSHPSSELSMTAFPESRLKEKPMDLISGTGTGLFRQSWVLFLKRWTVIRHNYLPYCAAFLLPVVAAGLVTLFLKDFKRLSCSPSQQSSESDVQSLPAVISPDMLYGPPDVVPGEALFQVFHYLNSSSIHAVRTTAEFNAYIAKHYGRVLPGGFFLDTNGSAPLFAYAADFFVGASVLVQNLLDNIISQVPIETLYQPLATPFAPGAGNTLQLILYFGLAMCAYTGFFSLYPTAERLRKVRALHYSNGVRALPLWVAYATFDFLWVLLISVIAIALFVSQFSGWYFPGYLFVVFFLFGLASTAFAYAISLFVSSQLAAFAFTAGAQASLFLLYFIAYLSIITYAPVSYIDDWVTIAHFTIALITPAGNLLRSLLLSLNEFSLLCDGRTVRTYGGDILVYGGPILYLLLQFFLIMTFVVWWDSGGRISFRRSHLHTHDSEKSHIQDDEVIEELGRVSTGNDGLRVLHLTRNFGTNVAVEDVTFGIQKGETFALLGPNGAGKSTTISLVRGDLRPSDKESEVFVEGNSIMKQRIAARNHLGVCPQFDAIDQMTVISHLRFYARVRGVADVDHNVREVMRAVGLQMYANRMAAKLSGGNKRKLSLAIALMGNPVVLLLDEPSSGMDAAAKRVMWRVLGSITDGRALLITTHSMEEADALAQRAGIMARRMLTLGTTDVLRKRHGDAYHVHLVHKDAPHTSSDEMERVKNWIRKHIPNAELEERTYHGQLRFSVANSPNEGRSKAPLDDSDSDPSTESIVKVSKGFAETGANGQSINALFRLLESNRQELSYAYYSVQPTTLDQVFLNVVRKHNVEEENYNREHVAKRSIGRRFTDLCRKIVSDA